MTPDALLDALRARGVTVEPRPCGGVAPDGGPLIEWRAYGPDWMPLPGTASVDYAEALQRAYHYLYSDT